MIPVGIRSGSGEYPALVGSGLLENVAALVAERLSGKCAIITDRNVGKYVGVQLVRVLAKAGLRPLAVAIPPGEQSKKLKQVGDICDKMLAAGLDRQSFVIGLGGGVVGDVSGFVAAIFQRGIPHVQIPTTLLAMVDSSVGGKTGVNTREGKNMIGATHHPSLVIDDVDLLKTLPAREFKQGFAEIIKHAVIADAAMFNKLAQSELDSFDPSGSRDDLIELIARNIQIKASVVAKDEFDKTGERALLNFGHTVGHGIERAGNYRAFRHGEAISLGMVAACAISVRRAGMPKKEADAIVDLLRRFELPVNLPKKFDRVKILKALKCDKKFEAGGVRFVVAPQIGSARLTSDVTLEDIREAIDAL